MGVDMAKKKKKKKKRRLVPRANYGSAKVVYSKNKQTPVKKHNKRMDSKLKASLPGKRISKSGKIYYEYRANRSDKKGKRI